MAGISRRRVLAAGLGGAALVATGGVWRVTRTPQTAYMPWELDPSPPADVRLDAFRHAILAPNPHNRQPWVIELVGADEAIVSCDLERRLPVTDPFDRQITIGFGTFLELARIAAAERGVALEIEAFPEGEDARSLDARPVARLRFIADPAVSRDPLFAQITRRRSNKEEYDLSRKVSAQDLAAVIRDGGTGTVDPARLAMLREQIVAGIEAEITTRPAYMESVELMRIGHEEIDANPDGIDLDGPIIEAGKLFGLVDRATLADMESDAYRQGLEMTRATYGSIPALIWIATPGNSRADQLEAGRQYVRANLHATAAGMAMHPMSQTLQEFAEVAPMFARVHELLGTAGHERVQMLARIGYGPEVGPSPRWPVETHIV
ncbi:hypothetical protein P7228_04935 [Altererythrobacter arenosus]|uniref:Twin-arginine translocation pathway signal protein n=1 Tax=Altererythrobacter arenosus TaxID=3032592 RepID=A0ABY8FTT8_9SPHN|nr:hypothetical protein [Altererythrobacter sp. CAU 1644]WFL78413.1 hypothetical protein P7228_04935 [Altererythrobacter sp. CAU 1644]